MPSESNTESSIQFFVEGDDLSFSISASAEKEYLSWLDKITEHYQVEIEGLNYIFCSDAYLLDINRTYLDHDYYTDIITFPYKQGKTIQSDIYISIDRVKDNAQEEGVAFNTELLRVMAHGLLHLIGYDDKSEEKAIDMRKQEDHCISLF